MTGAGIVLNNSDANEVERRMVAFGDELKPSSEVGNALVRHAAVCSVRMDRGAAHETASIAERIRRAEAEFVAPEWADEKTIVLLRTEAIARSLIDTSREALLARKYEAAASRGFFRALKELHILEKQPKVEVPEVDEQTFRKELASFLEIEAKAGRIESLLPQPAPMPPIPSSHRFDPSDLTPVGGGIDVPFAIGKRR